MTPLLPGVYADERGELHIDLAVFLAANGYADTPETRDTLLAAARDAFGDVIVTDDPIDPPGSTR